MTQVNPGQASHPAGSIPNNVSVNGDRIGEMFASDSATLIKSQKLLFRDATTPIDWTRLARGAHSVLKSGGKVEMNVWARSEAEVEYLLEAFRKAGFRRVERGYRLGGYTVQQSTQPGTTFFVTAIK